MVYKRQIKSFNLPPFVKQTPQCCPSSRVKPTFRERCTRWGISQCYVSCSSRNNRIHRLHLAFLYVSPAFFYYKLYHLTMKLLQLSVFCCYASRENVRYHLLVICFVYVLFVFFPLKPWHLFQFNVLLGAPRHGGRPPVLLVLLFVCFFFYFTFVRFFSILSLVSLEPVQ